MEESFLYFPFYHLLMLTFDKIRDLERKEKESKQLQKLPAGLIAEMKEYIERRGKIKEKSTLDILEMKNVNDSIKRIFEIRERKIMELALFSARTGNPPENLLPTEDDFFQSLLSNLESFRSDIKRELSAPKEVREKEKKIVYRVRKSVPDFVGPDMKIYKLSENDIVDLPEDIRELLLKEGVLERITE